MLRRSWIVFFLLCVLFENGQAKSKPKALLHIGPVKTASSYFQKFVKDHKELLEKENYYFPKMRDRNQGLGINDVFLEAIPGKNSERGNTTMDIVVPFLKESLALGHNIIFSSALFHELDKEGAIKLQQMLHGFDIHVVCMYREWLAQAISLHFQLVRHERVFSEPLSDYLFKAMDNMRDCLQPMKYMETFTTVYGEDKVSFIDMAGAAAAGVDVGYVALCNVTGIMCNQKELFITAPHVNTKYSLIPDQVYTMFHTFYTDIGCADIGSHKQYFLNFYNEYVNGTTINGVTVPAVRIPVVDSHLTVLRPYAESVDRAMRARYGKNIVYGNATANQQELDAQVVEELNQIKFLADHECLQWLQWVARLWMSEGRLIHCTFPTSEKR